MEAWISYSFETTIPAGGWPGGWLDNAKIMQLSSIELEFELRLSLAIFPQTDQPENFNT